MTDDRLMLAIGRLEQAVGHLEAGLPAILPPVPDRDVAASAERHDRLASRHQALRARTAAAVERLGRLVDAAPAAADGAD